MPSDTVYGLFCKALDERAVSNLNKIKNRSSNKPYIVLISNLRMLDMLSIDQEDTKIAAKYWPGALTFICPAANSPYWLHRGTNSLAIRIPNDEDILDLIETVGPIISTSANLENESMPASVIQAKQIFKDKVKLYIEGEVSDQASTIVRSSNGTLQVIRQGAVKI